MCSIYMLPFAHHRSHVRTSHTLSPVSLHSPCVSQRSRICLNWSFAGRNAHIGVSPSENALLTVAWNERENQSIIKKKKAAMHSVCVNVCLVFQVKEKRCPNRLLLTDWSHELFRQKWQFGLKLRKPTHKNVYSVTLIILKNLFIDSWHVRNHVSHILTYC